MSVVSGNVSSGSFALRLLSLAAAPLIAIGSACSGDKPNNPQSNTTDVSVTETTKNPLAGLNAAAVAGKTLYAVNCASCHGDDGKGEGDFAASLPTKPSNLTAENVVSATDGKIFLVIKNGTMRDGKVTMPPARGVTDEQIWQIVSYVRTLSENQSKNQTGNKKED
ncbi:MAG TPA: cytochrome c [Blastocatellia bacterium]|nr:cytochrome c [Blastocatellia bacterium]